MCGFHLKKFFFNFAMFPLKKFLSSKVWDKEHVFWIQVEHVHILVLPLSALNLNVFIYTLRTVLHTSLGCCKIKRDDFLDVVPWDIKTCLLKCRYYYSYCLWPPSCNFVQKITVQWSVHIVRRNEGCFNNCWIIASWFFGNNILSIFTAAMLSLSFSYLST